MTAGPGDAATIPNARPADGRTVLRVEALGVAYERPDGEPSVVVRDVSFDLRAGRILGMAGESGCGKSTAALAAIGFRSPSARVTGGRSLLGGDDLLGFARGALREVWGSRIAYVAQDATGALNPLQRVMRQLREPLELHLGLSRAEQEDRALELLDAVGIPDPRGAARRYPFQFSGGQQQRIALAVAMACSPEVLVLDEPTTGLDVTTQKQISALIARLVGDSGAAALHISHDLSLLASTCDDLVIMYAGEVVERSGAGEVYARPRHPYSAALIDAVPRVDEQSAVVGLPGLPPASVVTGSCAFAERCRFVQDRCRSEAPALTSVSAPAEPPAGGHDVRCLRAAELGPIPTRRPSRPDPAGEYDTAQAALLQITDLRCAYPGARGRPGLVAVDGVSLDLRRGETVAVVGESGSGKSTLLRAVAGLHTPLAGTIAFDGTPLAARAVDRARPLRRAIQIVFQDPNASLNPRHSVATTVERPLRLFRPELGARERAEHVMELLADVRLDAGVADRMPHELSGGQKQRVALARAFAAEPELILCDEVVSALDVSVQASILQLLARLAAERQTALLFVTHDLAVVRQIAERVCVMHNGRICERGETRALFAAPQDAYTRALLAAVPRPTDPPRVAVP